ncbi:MAG: hypothetical protein KGI89_17450, partial [Euryarchaeota archaeon]|nr:hypothetical protein [Euryarchaeota archaeon]
SRISRASYVARHMASELNMVVLVISSIARDKYTVIANAAAQSGITFDVDANGLPINRRIKNPDALVGLGKESGDIEFSADSVSAIARIPDTDDMLWITAKGRATGATWSPMRFTGFRYEEPLDGGRGIALAFQGAEQKREEAKSSSEKEKFHRTAADAVLVIRHIQANPDTSARRARAECLADSSSRWKEVVDLLGTALVQVKGGRGKKDTVSIVVPELPSLIRDVLRAQPVTDGSQNVNSGSYRGDRGSTVDPRSGKSVEVVGVDPWIGSALKGRPSTVTPSTVPSTVGGDPKSTKRGSTVADVSAREQMYDMMREAESQGFDPAGWATERATEMGWTDQDIQDGVETLARGRPGAEDPLSGGGGAAPEMVDALVRLVAAQPNITRVGLEQAMGVPDIDELIEAALDAGRIRVEPVNSRRTFVVEPEK